jgi:hypothetical protein
MHDHIRLKGADCPRDRLGVADVAPDELESRGIGDRREGRQVASVSELVKDADLIRGAVDNMPRQGRTDETGPR